MTTAVKDFTDHKIRLGNLNFHYLDWGNPEKQPILCLHGGSQTAHSWDEFSQGDAGRLPCRRSGPAGPRRQRLVPQPHLHRKGAGPGCPSLHQSLGPQGRHSGRPFHGGAQLHRLRRHAPREAIPARHRGHRPRNDEKGRPGHKEVHGQGTFCRPSTPSSSGPTSSIRAGPSSSSGSAWGIACASRKTAPGRGNYDRRFRSPARNGAYNQELWPYVRRIKTPMLLVRGAQSDILAAGPAKRFHAAVPGSRLVTIDNAGHTVNGDNPPAFNAAVKDFLQSR